MEILWNGEVTLYINTDNIEKTLKTIIKAEGEIDKKRILISDEFRFFALFQDTSSNLMGLWLKN